MREATRERGAMTDALRTRLALAAVAACSLVGVIDPAPTYYLRSALAFHDFLHVPAFSLIAALLLAAFPYRDAQLSRRVSRCALILIAAVSVGIAIELLQLGRGGDADIGDVARDTTGGAVALVVVASFWREVGPAGRWAMRAVSVLILVISALPAFAALLDEEHARRQFPVLADFNDKSGFDRIDWSPRARPTRVYSADGVDCVARVSLLPGEYPGFAFIYFPRDWRGFRSFAIDCANRSPTPLPITIRIDDLQHNEEYTDRFNRTYLLTPGANHIVVALRDVETAPRGRTLDLARVRSVVVFAYRLQERREIDIKSLKLDR